MRITIKGQEGQFTFIAIVAEEVVIKGGVLVPDSKKIEAMVYCHDKERNAYVFPAKDIERYD